jgi:hypothetical protein
MSKDIVPVTIGSATFDVVQGLDVIRQMSQLHLKK